MEPGDELDAVMGDALEAIRLVAIMATPAMPATCEEIWRRIGLSGAPSDEVFDASTAWGQYAATAPIVKGEPALPADEERIVSHWTDAHCHLQEQFLRGDDASLAVVTETLSRAYEGGVDRVVVIGTTPRRRARRSTSPAWRDRSKSTPRWDCTPTTRARTSRPVLRSWPARSTQNWWE